MHIKKHIFTMAAIISISLSALTSCQNNNAFGSLAYSFTLLNSTYYGTYEGEISGNLPNGEGTFISDDDYTTSFSVNGTWENGFLVSESTVEYSDGSTLTGSFSDGNISGTVIYTFADKTYQRYKCIEGEPSGLITNYSADGEVVSYDWFYQSVPISTLKEEAEEVDYADLIYQPSSYYGIPVRITGTVDKIYDSSSRSYCILTDDEEHTYIITYKNTTPATYDQARTPNLIVGDQITAYGYINTSIDINLNDLSDSRLAIENNLEIDFLQDAFSTFDEDNIQLSESDTSDEEDLDEAETAADISDEESERKSEDGSTATFEFSCPCFTLIAADISDSAEFDRMNPVYSYEDINRYPFDYAGLKHTFTGEVINLIADYELDCIRMLVREEGTSDIYYCNYFYSADSSEYPVIGDTVEITGTLKGNYKIYYSGIVEASQKEDNGTYILYPRLRVNKISIK